MIKTIAVDIGNVSLLISPPACAKALGITAEMLSNYQEFELSYERGEVSDEAFFHTLREKFPDWSEEALRDAFDSGLLDPMPGMEDALERLSTKGVKIVFLSDISPAHLAGFRRRFRNADKYEGVYSFLVGGLKPSDKMLGTFEKRYGRPDLYIDDRKDLIDAALARGWNAQVFQGAEWLENLVANS